MLKSGFICQNFFSLFFSFFKAKAVMAKVGYPQFIMNDTYINEDIKTVSVRLAPLLIYCSHSLLCFAAV